MEVLCEGGQFLNNVSKERWRPFEVDKGRTFFWTLRPTSFKIYKEFCVEIFTICHNTGWRKTALGSIHKKPNQSLCFKRKHVVRKWYYIGTCCGLEKLTHILLNLVPRTKIWHSSINSCLVSTISKTILVIFVV